MSDAQIDGGDNGAKAQDTVAGFVGDQDNEGAVRWYGIYSGALALGSLVFYEFINNNMGGKQISSFSGHWLTNSYVYSPVFIMWLMVTFFDSEMMRVFFQMVVTLSIFASFYDHWSDLITLVNSNFGGLSVSFWIWWAVHAAATIVEQLIVLLLVPKIYDWADVDDMMEIAVGNFVF